MGLQLQIYSVLVDTLLSASDILRICPSSLLSCAEYKAEEPYFFCNDRYLKIIQFCILMRFGIFRKYLTITKRKQDC